jgi:hypothetical protein
VDTSFLERGRQPGFGEETAPAYPATDSVNALIEQVAQQVQARVVDALRRVARPIERHGRADPDIDFIFAPSLVEIGGEALDLLRGVKAISEFLGVGDRRGFWLCETGRVPCFKEGRAWVSSRAALREHYERCIGPAARAINQNAVEDPPLEERRSSSPGP